MPVEKSSASRTASENAVLRKVAPISSAIEISVLQITDRLSASTDAGWTVVMRPPGSK